MSSIYEIKSDYMYYLDALDDPDVDEDSLMSALMLVQDDLHEKAEQYAMIIKTLESKAEAYRNEEKRCAEHRKVVENNIKRMKNDLFDAMEMTGDTKFESGLFKFSIRNNAPSLLCDDEPALMNELRNMGRDDLIKVESKLNKKEILTELKSGILSLDYGSIKKDKSLSIR